MSIVLQLLQEEEGVSSHAYRVNGLIHVAMGCLIDSSVPSDGLCKEAIDVQSLHDIAKAQATASALPGFSVCNEVRQAVLISMLYQLGSLSGWPSFRAALASGDYKAAALAGLDSQWARVQTPTRAERQMQMLETGVWSEKGVLES